MSAFVWMKILHFFFLSRLCARFSNLFALRLNMEFIITFHKAHKLLRLMYFYSFCVCVLILIFMFYFRLASNCINDEVSSFNPEIIITYKLKEYLFWCHHKNLESARYTHTHTQFSLIIYNIFYELEEGACSFEYYSNECRQRRFFRFLIKNKSINVYVDVKDWGIHSTSIP